MRIDQKKPSLLSLLREMLEHRQAVFQVVSLQLIWGLLTLMFPFLTQILVDQAISFQDIDMIYLIIASMFMLFIGSTGADFFKEWMLKNIGIRLHMRIVNDFVGHLLAQGIHLIHTKKEGEILQSFVDTHRIEGFLTIQTVKIVNAVFKFVLFGAILFIFDLRVGIIFLIVVIAMILWHVAFIPMRSRVDEWRFKVSSKSRNQLLEIFSGSVEIKANNLEHDQMSKWYEIQDGYSMARLRLQRIAHMVLGGAYTINHLKDVLIIFYTALAVVEGNLSLGAMLAITYILGQLNHPMLETSITFSQWIDARLSLQRINMYSGDQKEEYLPPDHFPPLELKEDILVSNLSYSYDKEQKVLENISIDIPYGKKIAIVGESGSGKSTFIKILLKLINYTEGQIAVNRQDLRSINDKSWRKGVSSVLQEGYVFAESLKYNIALTRDDKAIDFTRIHEAIRVSCLEDLLQDLPDGLETKIGKAGRPMSKGQAQRVLLARAIYKNGDYLIMDEPTSALDNLTSRKVIKNISEYFNSRSIIIATHKLPIAEYFDYVFLFRNGKIIEKGTHMELMANEAEYYELYHSFLKIQ